MNAKNILAFEANVHRVLSTFCANPPRLLVHVGSFIRDISPFVYDLHYYFETNHNTDRQRALFALVSTTITVIVETMLDNYCEFCHYHTMKNTGPCNTLMGLLVIMSLLVAIVDDKWALAERWTVYCRPTDKKPLKIAASAETFPYLMRNGCIVSPVAVCGYTFSELTMAMQTLGLNWYKLEPVDEVETYIKGLLHRWCVISASPSKSMQAAQTNASVDVNKWLTDRLRTGIQLVRMLWPFHFFRVNEQIDPVAALFGGDQRLVNANIENLRAKILETVIELSKTRGVKSEIVTKLQRLLVLYGDPEQFVNTRGLERAQASVMIMTVRPEIFPEMTRFYKSALMTNMCKLMKEEDAEYYKKYTYMEHMFAVLMKTYTLNSLLASHELDFFKDFVAYEMDIPLFYREFRAKQEPLLLCFFSRMCVFFDKKVYMCTSVEMAIVVWAKLIMTKLSSRLKQRDMSVSLLSLIGMTQYKERTVETLTHVFTSGNANEISTFFTEGDILDE